MPFNALIASGESSLVDRFTAALCDIGVSVDSVSQIDPALSVLASRKYQAVLLDCELQEAIELLELIRTEPLNRRALVLAFAHNEEATRKAQRLGATFVLPKPIDWQLANRTLRAARGMIIRERRRCVREKVRGLATLKHDDGIVEGALFDLSSEGLALRTSATIPLGVPVQVEFSVAQRAVPIGCAGTVAWTSDGLVGVSFSGLPESSAQVISSLVDRRGRAIPGQRSRGVLRPVPLSQVS